MIKICKDIDDIRNVVKGWKKEGLTVGLVPTMGYLHEGHESLIRRAVSENDKVIVSDFVNPIQFAPNEDLDEYPRDLDRDAMICEQVKADILFVPEYEEMYRGLNKTFVTVDDLTKELCGKSRPTHFRGVCIVVTKLFNIVNPDRAYFGEKDAQQLAVIRQMVSDLNFDIEIVGCPIIREEDGLAKSSRNKYLNEEERKAAPIINHSLRMAKEEILAGETDVSKIIEMIKNNIETEKTAKIDYIEIVDAKTIEKVEIIDKPILCAVAVRFGETRLIDNFGYIFKEID
ncbi:MAG TPA: pantoate--beta-alanine ligase [Anaerovoracaceae bacterium]|nr:pantoate--beta-alanine ligase [Anaerovoracaceae bacterium]